MSRYGVLAAALLVVSQGVWAATVPPEIKQVVAFVFANDKTGKPVPYGTGFFVGVKSPKNPERSFSYFVTAKHVLQEKPGGPFLPRVELRLNRKAGDSVMVPVPIVLAGPKRTVFLHPDPTVDLAVIPALPDEKTMEFKLVPEDMLTSTQQFSELNIAEGSEVFFAGLFTPHVGLKRNYPIVRFGRVALVTPEKIDWNGTPMDLYLLESSSYGGNSGSPVFFSLGIDRQPGSIVVGPPRILLAGVMMGAFQQGTPLQAVQTGVVPISLANIGIAAVVPAYRLHEILFGEELAKLRSQP